MTAVAIPVGVSFFAATAAPLDKRRRRTRTIPAGLRVMEEIGRLVLRANTVEEAGNTITANLERYYLAKHSLAFELLGGKWNKAKFAALSRLSLDETDEWMRGQAEKRLPPEAGLTLVMTLDAFARANAHFLEAATRDPSRFAVLTRDLQSYVALILVLEILQIALCLHLSGEAKPRNRALPEQLVKMSQTLADQLTATAERMGLFGVCDPLEVEQPDSRDAAVDAMVEGAWEEACRGLREQERVNGRLRAR